MKKIYGGLEVLDKVKIRDYTLPTTTGNEGEVITVTSGGNTIWALPGALTTPALDLDDLQDVSASSPNSGDVLQFNGTEWIPVAPTQSLPVITPSIVSANRDITPADHGRTIYVAVTADLTLDNTTHWTPGQYFNVISEKSNSLFLLDTGLTLDGSVSALTISSSGKFTIHARTSTEFVLIGKL